MKIVLTSIFAIILFSEMKMDNENVFSCQCSPLQDTLIKGVDNYLQIFENGKINTKPDWSICISGGSLTAVGNAKYKVLVPERMAGDADITIFYHQKKVFEKKFITRPKKENE